MNLISPKVETEISKWTSDKHNKFRLETFDTELCMRNDSDSFWEEDNYSQDICEYKFDNISEFKDLIGFYMDNTFYDDSFKETIAKECFKNYYACKNLSDKNGNNSHMELEIPDFVYVF